MKKKIIAVILTVLMMLTFVGTIIVNAATDYASTSFESEEAKLENMKLAKTSPNGVLQLYYDENSGEIALKNIKTGDVLLSNPYDISKFSVSNQEKHKYLSQVILDFKVISSDIGISYNSYQDSTLCNQMKITATDNGLSVEYEFGEEKEILLIPLEISEETLNSILGKIENEKDKNNLRNSYIDIGKERNGYKIYRFNTAIAVVTKRKRAKIIEDTGFTFEEMYAEYEKIGYVFEKTEVPKFNLTLEYELTDDGLKASIDTATINYDMSKYYITSLIVLPYFGASAKTDIGYNFIPDGSGALIRFEDILAKNNIDNVSGQIYGSDYAYHKVIAKNNQQVVLPVYGQSNTTKGRGFFAVIEDGDALATIISAPSAIYNSIYSSFNLLAIDSYDLADSFSSGVTNSSIVTVRAEDIYRGKCTINFTMLTTEEKAETAGLEKWYENSYVGMATCYRDYLTSNGSMNKITNPTDKTKLFLEVLGSVKYQDKILTFPVTLNKPLTTFEDIKTIHKELSAAGVGNMSFILTGFANEGLRQTKYPSKLKWTRVLGGNGGFNDILSYAKENGVEIAPNVDFVYKKGDYFAFSGLSNKKNATHTLDGRYTTKRVYDAAMQMFMRMGGISISAGSYETIYYKFYSSISGYENLEYLAPRTLSSDVNSDFDDKDFYTRQASMQKTVEMLSMLNGSNGNKGYSLIGDKGNAYAIPYYKSFIDVSLDSSQVFSASESVPFIGMVFHGSITFAGNAINTEGDESYAFLKSLENGSSLYFTLAVQNVELLKNFITTSKYYSVKYETWKNKIISMYEEYNSLMKNKQDQYITDHEFLNTEYGFDVTRAEDGAKLDDSKIVRVEYENGEGFILNYNIFAVKVVYNGVTYNMEPFSYATYTRS